MLPMHRSHGLQGSLKRRYKHPFLTSINGYHTAKNGLGAIVYKWPTFAFTSERRYTTRLSEKNRTQRLTRRNRGRFERGGITTLSTNCTFTNIPGPGIRTANFAAFGSWPRVLPKNAESLRSSDALMRVAAPRRRGPAGLRRPTPPAERTVLAPISPRVQLCLRRPAFPLSAFIPGA